MPTVAKRFQKALATATSVYPRPTKVLAEPPAGSGLKPVLGDAGLPFFGNTFEALADPLGSAMERFEKYGPVSWSGSLNMDMVTLVGPEAIECAWMNREKAFSSEQAGSRSSGRSSGAGSCCWTSASTCTTAGSCSRRSPNHD